MARPTHALIHALRETADRLQRAEVRYEWSHFGHCNCGHLARTLTRLPAETVYEAAFAGGGDWGEQAIRFDARALDAGDRPALDEGAFEPEPVLLCTATGAPLGRIFAVMFDAGLERRDIDALEDLSDGDVLRKLGANTTGLARGERENVVAYLRAWADLLEERLPRAVEPRDEAELAIAAEE